MSKDVESKKFAKLVGEHLKKTRLLKKLSTTRLAYNSDVQSSLISKIERGISEPHITTLIKILNGLDTTVDDFFKALDYSHL
ncbi:MAG: helix-turn-helix transcriptional regulator [Candidatus Margulisbacteria bacterium]|nr:helix-turn-helix transcriptional regulator [Candidatus Margulisiibacteriota bacterium]